MPDRSIAIRWKQVVAAVALGFAAAAAQGQAAYPTRPIRMIVPFAAGAATDSIARVVGVRLGERLGQPIVVENKTGAGGLIGMQAIAKSPPDGYVVGIVISTLSTAEPNVAKQGFDIVKDFAPVSLLVQMPVVIVAYPGAGINTFADLIAKSKAAKDPFGYSSAGIGSMTHLTAELIKYKTGAQLLHVPYRGGAPALQASLAGEVPLQLAMPTTVGPYLATGKLKGLAVSSSVRTDLAPDVPTLVELGFKDLETTEWYGLVAPAGTPPEIINKLSTQIAEILKEPDVRSRLKGMIIVGGTPEAFDRYIVAERTKWSALVKAANLKLDE
ncbi:MAG: tripartite tricarboxylate transporter substrate binding protein [Casimicrobiaceae bacterium]